MKHPEWIKHRWGHGETLDLGHDLRIVVKRGMTHDKYELYINGCKHSKHYDSLEYAKQRGISFAKSIINEWVDKIKFIH